ncbi:MAG: M24 family metallopeptidase [Chloroflexota bacterium]
MESMKTTLRRGRNVWDRVNVPASEFQARVGKAREEMKKENIDVLLVYGDAWVDYADPCYFSNLYSAMGALVAVIPRQGEVALAFWGSGRGIEYTQINTWLKELRPGADVAGSCVKYLEELGLLSATIGLAGFRELMPYNQLQPFLKSLAGCKTVDANHIIRGMRMVKSPKERDQVTRASRILTHVFETIVRTPPKDRNELTLDAALDREARLEGAEDVRLLYAKPREAGWTFRPVEDSQLSPGDTVIIYLAVEFERYWAEAIRTFVIEPTGLSLAGSEALDRLYETVMQKMGPGKKVAEFYREAAAAVEKSGTGYMTEYGLGNGIGLSVDEPPVIAEEDSNVLTPGMCLTLRLAVKDRDRGAIMTGNTVYLAASGPELLTG